MESENKIHELKQILENASAQLNQAKQMLAELSGDELAPSVKLKATALQQSEMVGSVQVVEGVFDGQNMVGPDGKIYTIPANYASKSKLVEGDILKLHIQPDGSFIYKQIGPVERARIVGKLVRDSETGDYTIVVDKKAYKVIMASITYFKGQPGDEVAILVPEDGDSTWAAVENVIHQPESVGTVSQMLEQGSLESGSAAELTDGSEAELLPGDSAELGNGSSAALEDGTQAQLVE